jgi:RNA polymerase sigma factor (sigma-70 family)
MLAANDDFALWQLFKRGDKESFQSIYFSHFNNLYEYGIRIVSDKESVKDSIHDLFLKLWNNRSNLGDIKNIRPYLLVSLRAVLYNKQEKISRVKLVELDEQLPFEMAFSVESVFISKEIQTAQTQKLIDALNQLTPRQKEVIYLRYFEELDYEEIATIMEINVKATYKLMARGLETLRNLLNLSNTSLLILLAFLRAKTS